MSNFLQQEKERIARMNAETAHEQHIKDFQSMCAQMIDEALRQHDQQVEVDVQTTLNGRPTTMAGLVADIKKQIYEKLRKAFK